MHRNQQWSFHGFYASEVIPSMIKSRGQIEYFEIHSHFSHCTKYSNFAFTNLFTKVYNTKHSHGHTIFSENIIMLIMSPFIYIYLFNVHQRALLIESIAVCTNESMCECCDKSHSFFLVTRFMYIYMFH